MAKQTGKQKAHQTKAAQAVKAPRKIDGMKAFDETPESMQNNPILASFRFILAKDVDSAHSGMLSALRRMADNYSWETEAKFVFDVGKTHIEPLGGEIVAAFNTALKGKKTAGTIGYRRKCARAYELWVDNLPLMIARENEAKSHLVGKLSPKEQERIKGLRSVFHAETVANHIIYRRGGMLMQAMPGEPGYSYAEHVKAYRHAIEDERERRLDDAEEFKGDRSEQLHSFKCETMYDYAVKRLCGWDPAIAEAYRQIKPKKTSGKSSVFKSGSGLTLVHSRD